jgi:hypothetical protein
VTTWGAEVGGAAPAAGEGGGEEAQANMRRAAQATANAGAHANGSLGIGGTVPAGQRALEGDAARGGEPVRARRAGKGRLMTPRVP